MKQTNRKVIIKINKISSQTITVKYNHDKRREKGIPNIILGLVIEVKQIIAQTIFLYIVFFANFLIEKCNIWLYEKKKIYLVNKDLAFLHDVKNNLC